MTTFSTQPKIIIPDTEITPVQVVSQKPDQLIGVRTSRIYSQIARISCNSHMQSEKAILVDTLEQSKIQVFINGRSVRKDPPFIKMTAQNIKRCFGKQVDKLPRKTFIKLK